MTPAIQALLELSKELPGAEKMEKAGAIYKKGFDFEWSKTHIALKRAEPDLIELLDAFERINKTAMIDHLNWMNALQENKFLKEQNAELLKDRERLARMTKALDAATDLGIYCAAVEGTYEKRTDFMEGWNAHAIESMKEISKVLEHGDWIENDSDAARTTTSEGGI